jgi:hypothetical protein
MARKNPIDSAFWLEAVDETGFVLCEGCGNKVDITSADTINEGVGIWKHHSSDCEDSGIRKSNR